MSATALILTTLETREAAETLARTLVGESRAACVSILGPMRSIYRWKEAVEEADEFLLLIKRPAEGLEAFETLLRRHHPYETPEFLVFRADQTGADYLAWLAACVPHPESTS